MERKTLPFSTIDEYIRQFSPDIQNRLRKLKQIIQVAAPGATEKISYQMPAFSYYGNLVFFAAYATHIGFYPGPAAIDHFAEELKSYPYSKGTIRFPLNQEIPWDLIGRIVDFRQEANLDAKRKAARKYTFNPFPILTTDRLILREMTEADAQDLFSMRSDPRMNAYTDEVEDRSLDDTKKYMEKMQRGVAEDKWIVWAIESKADKKVVGSISLWNLDPIEKTGELGFGIHPDFQNKGLMKETLPVIVDYGFHQVHLTTIEAYTEIHNASSNALLNRFGFHVEKQIEEEGFQKARTFRMNVYRMTKPKTKEKRTVHRPEVRE